MSAYRVPMTDDNIDVRRFCIILGVLFSAGVLGAGLVTEPLLVFTPLIPISAVLMIRSANARLTFLVIAGLATLGSSSGLSLLKFLYLGGCAIAFVIALLHPHPPLQSKISSIFRPLQRLSLLWAGLIAVSLLVAIGGGTSFTSWVRDAIPYLLFAAIPVFARDLATPKSQRVILIVLVMAGFLSAVSFAVVFSSERGFVEFPVERIVLASFLLPAAAFSYSVSAGLQGSRYRFLWLSFASFILTCYLITGTRSSFILLISPVVIVLAVKAGRGRRIISTAVATIVVVGLLVILSRTLESTLDLNLDQVTQRLSTVDEIFDSSSVSGQSYEMRSLQTEMAWKSFRSNLLFGTGPGYVYNWSDRFGHYSSFFLDSPMSLPAKFGILGCAVLAITLAVYAKVLFRLRTSEYVSVSGLAIMGYLAIVGVWLMVSSPFEDKGFSFGLLLLLALAIIALESESEMVFDSGITNGHELAVDEADRGIEKGKSSGSI